MSVIEIWWFFLCIHNFPCLLLAFNATFRTLLYQGSQFFYWWRNKHIFHFWGFTVTDLNCTVRPNNICKSITFSRWHFLINKDLPGKTFISLNDRQTHNLYMAIGLLYCLLLLIVNSHSITWSYDHMFICLSLFIDTTDTLLNTGSVPNGSKFKVT